MNEQTQQTLTWTNPSSADLSAIVLRGAVGSTAPKSPTSGTALPVASATATSAVVAGLTSDTTYSYSVFARDRDGQYSTPDTTTATTASCTPEPDYLAGGDVSSDMTLTSHCVSRYVLTRSVTVEPGITITVQPGVTIAAAEGAGITVDGTLLAEGTGTEPVTFTSAADDPQPGDWPGINIGRGGAATLTGTTLEYAATALQTATGTHVAIHGQILHSAIGVQAPDSTTEPGGVLDARNVWWGATSGPAPIGTGTLIQGSGVVVTPWTGLTTPPRPPAAPVDTTAPASTACADVLFLGARGSGEAPQGDAIDDPATTERQLLGTRVASVLDALTAALPNIHTRVVGLRYAATPPQFAAPSDYTTAYYDAVWAGVDQLEATLSREHTRCPAERIVLAGYSQGALVIHLALNELDHRGTLATYPIAAVELIADPARTSNDGDTRYGTAPTTDAGVWGVALAQPVPLPPAIATHTAEYCHADDSVCDTSRADSTLNYNAYDAPHATYPIGNELTVLGQHAARSLS